ncbi:hypothetical protein NPIL_532341 [Nephila pilipes]|uniref:Uncharacterized protein n=1 Tax=Nephila pilipes TaxID=299642 RepID=A0A8X6QFK6_NEPPI|nr:hypothetical protein NPIL_532341 [Nephila pilipes]
MYHYREADAIQSSRGQKRLHNAQVVESDYFIHKNNITKEKNYAAPSRSKRGLPSSLCYPRTTKKPYYGLGSWKHNIQQPTTTPVSISPNKSQRCLKIPASCKRGNLFRNMQLPTRAVARGAHLP